MGELLQDIKSLREKFSKTYQRIWFDVPLLRQPAWQQITLLPESYQAIHKANIAYRNKNSGQEVGFAQFKDLFLYFILKLHDYRRHSHVFVNL